MSLDHNKAENIWDADFMFVVTSNFFCVYFTFEVVVLLAGPPTLDHQLIGASKEARVLLDAVVHRLRVL